VIASLTSGILVTTALACGGSSPTPIYVTPSPRPTATETWGISPITPAPGSSPVAGAWTLVPATPALANVSLNNVVWTDERFVAAANTDGGVRFFASTDGSAWTAQGSAYADTLVSGLAYGSGGLLAVGAHKGALTSWHSNDGLSWAEAPDAPALEPSPGNHFEPGAVAAVGGGWIAVGGEYEQCLGDYCAPLRAVVWTTSDGWNWNRAPTTPALANAAMMGIAPWTGGYVAVGWAGMNATIWTSPDAAAWTTVPDDPIFHPAAGADPDAGAGALRVTFASGRFVAVGQTFAMAGSPAAMVWWSDDGSTWSAASVELSLGGAMSQVAAVPTGFMAVGPSGSPSCLGGVWSSSDGQAWQCVASDAAFQGFAPADVAASSSREVVVGFGSPHGALNGSIWYRDIAWP
jgi:hypothetical protein